MDETADGVHDDFKRGDQVRLLRDYPELNLKRGRKGTFFFYSGQYVFAEVQFGDIPVSVYSSDLEMVDAEQFQFGDRVRLTRKCGKHKRYALATFIRYNSDPGDAAVQFDRDGTVEQVPVAWLILKGE